MKVRQLLALLECVNPETEIMVEVTTENGHEVAPVISVTLEERCDERECLYIAGDQEVNQDPEIDPEIEPARMLRLVR